MLSKPHLVPANLIGKRFARDTFGATKIALVGYCPPPPILEKYNPIATHEQYFIHLSPASVFRCVFEDTPFLSLVHVYGGPVSSSTVEELAYYGIETILAYGLAGGLGTKQLQMNDFYLVESAFVGDGTTPHYTDKSIVTCDASLQGSILSHASNARLPSIASVRAFTGDAIYREDGDYIQKMKALGCDIVNLDSSHLYAASTNNSEQKQVRAIECGVISDVIGAGGVGADGIDDWESDLSVMLSQTPSNVVSPLDQVGKLVEFYVEQLAHTLD